MVVCFALLLVMAGLFVFSSSCVLPRGYRPPGAQKVFYRAAYYLLQKFARGQKEKTNAFAVARLADVLTAVFLGTGLAFLLQAVQTGKSVLTDGYILSRPAKGQGEHTQELQVRIGESQTEKMEIVLSERRYTEEEKQAFLAQAVKELETVILGENRSADEVRGRVILPDTLAQGNVKAVWTQEPAGLLDQDGYIIQEPDPQGELLQLKATLTCEGSESVYECALRLLPNVYSSEEQLRRALESEVERADAESAQTDILRLPTELGGKKLIWSDAPSSAAGVCLALTAFAAVCAWFRKNEETRRQDERRKRQMIFDYPDILFRLSMLLNSGLTMQNAFFKIALEYRNRREKETRYAYEEMLRAYYEMKSGVPEARAYENFGRRCGSNGYVKLGTMLSANLQKGSQGLAKLLQEEAQLSMEERLRTVRKLGEEAGTKLLLPMVLMLLVVLVILMAPAMMALGG